jgi:hypothetical protein
MGDDIRFETPQERGAALTEERQMQRRFERARREELRRQSPAVQKLMELQWELDKFRDYLGIVADMYDLDEDLREDASERLTQASGKLAAEIRVQAEIAGGA